MENIIGVFPDKKNADIVFDKLLQSGYSSSDISVVLKEDTAFEHKGKKGGMSTANVASGVVSGGLVGSLAGILLGISAIAIPGLGALVFAGPISAALGLTGAAAATVSGAATGALVGGLVGGLVELGLSASDASYYEKTIKEGGVLLSVPISDDVNASDVETLFSDYGAQYIRRVRNNEV